MKCPYCGNENNENFLFCGFCGKEVPQIPLEGTSSSALFDEAMFYVTHETDDVTEYTSEIQKKSTKAKPLRKHKTSRVLQIFLIISFVSGSLLGFLVAKGIISLEFLNPKNEFKWTNRKEIQTETVNIDEIFESETKQEDEYEAEVEEDHTPTADDEDVKEYILPESNSRNISESELSGLSQEEVRAAINELYARHGYRFTDAFWVSYFNSKSWYTPQIAPEDFSENVFNNYELANRKMLVEWEKSHGWR